MSFYRQRLQLLLSLLVLHADGAADEDDDEDHHGGPNGGDRDGDDVVTFNRGQWLVVGQIEGVVVTNNLHWTVLDTLAGNIQRVAIQVHQVQLAAVDQRGELLHGLGLLARVQVGGGHQVEAHLHAALPGPQVLDVGGVGVQELRQLLLQVLLESRLPRADSLVVIRLDPGRRNILRLNIFYR